jgi:hypothetical protein
MPGIYYYLDTSGTDTNLQIYSLKKAKAEWRDLQAEIMESGLSNVPQLKEKCVFMLATLGLSISQLLGQNNPTVTARVPFPINIFIDFVDTHGLDSTLKDEYERFNYFYNGCRHFGLTTNGDAYDRIDQLTYEVSRECFEFGLTVWRKVISVMKQIDENDLDEFDVDSL